MNWFQHGDVTIKPVKSAPKGARRRQGNTLMEGETTGHTHKVTEGEFDLVTKGGVLYFVARTPCVVTHEEHKPIAVPQGTYKVGRVREYDFFQKEIRLVKD